MVLPWTVCVFHLYKKDKKVVLFIVSFISIISFVVNDFGIYFGFWSVYPFDLKDLSIMPFNLGLYPILGNYMIFFIRKYRYPYLIILLMALITTILEIIFLLSGRVIYGNGWNAIWTFFSYLLPYLVVYWYYLYLKKLKIMN